MSDKPETEEHSKGAVRKRTLSFDEVMSGASPEPKPPPPKVEPPPAPKKSAQPTFEEILAKSSPPPEGAPSQRPDRGNRPSRPPRQKDERKTTVVVQRKPTLGATSMPPPVEMTAAPGEGNGQEEPAAAPRKRASAEVPESVFAQPGADEGGDFAALFAESGTQQKQGKLRVGQRVTARIAHLGGEVAFLDLGGKGEGIIDLGELRNEKGEVQAKIGETIEGYVLSVGDGVVLTKSVPKGAGREVVQAALDSKIPIEGVVTGQNKGGLEVDLGGLRGFVPTSQVDVRFVEDMSPFVGQKLKFRVTELRGGNAILSRRALLEEERAVQAKELRSKLEVGAQLDGVITSVRDFGAFVDLGGVEGLVHVSELSHTRVAHAQDAVKQGQKVKVQVLRIEKDEKGQERIGLSLRALEQDPWDAARSQIKEGMRLTGKVARLQPFGAFVELFPGVDGLVHVSALADRHIQHPRDVVKEGESILVQVESIDDDSRRIALRKVNEGDPVEKPAAAGAPAGAAAAGSKKPKVGDSFEVTVDKIEAFGVFVHWDGGKGLIPNSELGTPRGSDNKKTMPVGTKTKASIIEIDERGRYRLSRTSAERAAEGSDYRDYQREMNRKLAPGKGFGTLGDLLRAKLEPAEDDE
ncbi:MAG TPA: S1 RNA-binding domain-containing protein [Myxococcales bacterium]|jgi:small subunit ribosomal protein S1|nr:S1 RNA-binding domain-containing protein [Myxococcales bacterium]